MAQGYVEFNTKATGVWAPVYLPDPGTIGVFKQGNTTTGVPAGTTAYLGGFVIGSGFTAELWGGPVGGDMKLLATTTFKTVTVAALAGTVVAKNVEVLGVNSTQTGQFQVKAYSNEGGTINSWAAALADGARVLHGESKVFTCVVGSGPPGTPTKLVGLESFNLAVVPEPSVIALGVLGVGALVLFRRRK